MTPSGSSQNGAAQIWVSIQETYRTKSLVRNS